MSQYSHPGADGSALWDCASSWTFFIVSTILISTTDLLCRSRRKVLMLFDLRRGELSLWKMTSSLPKLLCGWLSSPRSVTRHQQLWKCAGFFCFFYLRHSFHVSSEVHQARAPASSPCESNPHPVNTPLPLISYILTANTDSFVFQSCLCCVFSIFKEFLKVFSPDASTSSLIYLSQPSNFVCICSKF